MSRSPIPLLIEDISTFARALRSNWPNEAPSQSAALTQIAKAAGYRNYQALKAAAPTDDKMDELSERRVKDALRVFDHRSVMIRWPQKTSVQRLCLTWFWSRLPARQDLGEKQVNEILKASEAFGDHVLLRRSLIDHGLVKRSKDGAIYRRKEQKPDSEQRTVIRALSERLMMAASS